MENNKEIVQIEIRKIIKNEYKTTQKQPIKHWGIKEKMF